MKFLITGSFDQKITIAIHQLFKLFNAQCVFVSNEMPHDILIETTSNHNELSVKITTSNDQIEQKTRIINRPSYDEKYLILACLYQFLHKKTNKTLSYGVLSGIRPTKLVHHYYNLGFNYFEIEKLLQEKYMIKENKAKLLTSVVKNQRELITDFDDLYKDISIYINIPYCASRCSYCSFTSYPINYEHVSIDSYLDVLIYEIQRMGDFIRLKGVKVTSIYVGGGTPTALNDKELHRLLVAIEEQLMNESIREYTLECGRPDTLTLSKLELIHAFSVTRISINPQTFKDETLSEINRNHSVNDIVNLYHLAKDIGFNNINMDLIIGLPNETIKDYEHSIEQILKLRPESITVHYLARKRGAELFSYEHKDDHDVYESFDYAYQNLLTQGYIPYYLYRQKNISGNLENIGYSLRGFESIYNIIMIEEIQNIIGLGCNASSKFLNHELILNPKDLITYTKSVDVYLDKKLENLTKSLLKVEEFADD